MPNPINYADTIDQATSDNIISGLSNTTAEGMRTVFGTVSDAIRFFQALTAGASIIVLPGAPGSAVGNDGDAYIDKLTSDFYQKTAGAWGAPLFQLKGKDGKTPRKGVDYFDGITPRKGSDYFDGQNGQSAYALAVADGYNGTVTQWLASLKGAPGAAVNGRDGNRNRWESYAPTTEAGLAGDAWYYAINANKIAIYECTAGALMAEIPDEAGTVRVVSNWRLRFTSPDPVTSSSPGAGSSYYLPQASATVLGGVKGAGAGLVGNVVVNSDGSLTAPAGAGGGLPDQTGQDGKYLKTQGGVPTWAALPPGSYSDIQARDAALQSIPTSSTITAVYNTATQVLTLGVKAGSLGIDRLTAAAIDALTNPVAKTPLTRDTLFWHEADAPGGFLVNKVPAGPGIYNLQSVGPGDPGGQPVSPTVPLRLTANALNGFPVVSFNNTPAAAPDRSTYNCNAFATLRYGPRPGTLTLLMRNASTAAAGSTDGRTLVQMGGIVAGVNGDMANYRFNTQVGQGWFIISFHFTWCGRTMIHLNGQYVGALPDQEDYMFGFNDGGYLVLFNNWVGDAAAVLISQDASRPAGLLHESYLANKYGISF